ncbi:stress response protein nst1-like [Anguilla anguilla]|uniref:stress response protein nst1-like n=1 Tax=Anguilla anguilla TaxID=7936 RepID=UPI0015B303AB|nr:stress response protein nst1-like [Anguilla anguilla]
MLERHRARLCGEQNSILPPQAGTEIDQETRSMRLCRDQHNRLPSLAKAKARLDCYKARQSKENAGVQNIDAAMAMAVEVNEHEERVLAWIKAKDEEMLQEREEWRREKAALEAEVRVRVVSARREVDQMEKQREEMEKGMCLERDLWAWERQEKESMELKEHEIQSETERILENWNCPREPQNAPVLQVTPAAGGERRNHAGAPQGRTVWRTELHTAPAGRDRNRPGDPQHAPVQGPAQQTAQSGQGQSQAGVLQGASV